MFAAFILILAGGGSASAGEVTGAGDNLRTGWYPDEGSLAPSLLTKERFTQVFSRKLDGQIYAQPLVANGTLLVVTEADVAYGLDPVTGDVRWETKVGEPVNANGPPVSCPDLSPDIGITGTPVIDTASNIAYFVANEKVGTEIATRMYGLDLSSGNRVVGPVSIEGGSQNLIAGKTVTFEPAHELQRPALLLMNGVIYAAFGGHCDEPPYHGWIVAVSTAGQVVSKWTTSSNGDSIWQGGGGLVSDGPGQILFTTGNAYKEKEPGLWDPHPKESPAQAEAAGRLGESVVRVEVQANHELKARDFFSPFESAKFDEGDIDLGSSAPVALPPQFGTASTPHLLVQEGKDGHVYLLNRENLGGRKEGKNEIVQELPKYGGVWGAAAVWPGDGGYVYVPAVSFPGSSTGGGGNHLGFFRYEPEGQTPKFSPTPAKSQPTLFFGSGSPIVTSNGSVSGTGVTWITRCPTEAAEGEGCAKAELLAFNAAAQGEPEPKPIWSAPIGKATKFSRPDANNGHLYVGTSQGTTKTESSGEIVGFSGPSVTPSSQSLNLGSTLVGGQLTGQVTFTNTGTPLKFNAVTASGPFAASVAPSVPRELAPGEGISVNVTFSSGTPGSFAGALELTTDAGPVTIPVSAAATVPAPATATTASLVTPLSIEPVLRLTNLRLRASASRLGAHRRKLVVSYLLSGAGKVQAIVYHRVVSHRCRRGVRTCGSWVRTKIKLKVNAHAGRNSLTVALGTIPAGNYRLAATPFNRSGVAGITQYLPFKTFH